MSESIIGYKLMRKMSDGYAPLFINKRQRLHTGVTYEALDIPTKGYAHRPGWHACVNPSAPHLSENGRVWVRVRLWDVQTMNRPVSQGGEWYLAGKLQIVCEMLENPPDVVYI